MKRGFVSCDANNGMSAALSRVPMQLPQMNASRIAEPGTNAVGRLGHRMPMQSHGIDVLHEYIQRAVIRVPRVLHLNRKRHWRHVEQVLESRRHLKVRAELRVVVIEVDRRRRLCYDAIIRRCRPFVFKV